MPTPTGIARKEKSDQAPADPATALAAVEAGGYAVEGEPKRKAKPFEVVGSRDGLRHAIHVAFDGTIRKAKPLVARESEPDRTAPLRS